jgi:hypothetical protein
VISVISVGILHADHVKDSYGCILGFLDRYLGVREGKSLNTTVVSGKKDLFMLCAPSLESNLLTKLGQRK